MPALKQAVAFRAAGFSPRLIAGLAVTSFIGTIVLLEILSRLGVMGPLTFPAPSDIGRALYEGTIDLAEAINAGKADSTMS